MVVQLPDQQGQMVFYGEEGWLVSELDSSRESLAKVTDSNCRLQGFDTRRSQKGEWG